ncbi:unnamed protein product [Rhizophagus irregularis]|nr:unnamed protein product [Rhizophagus irregularis]
MLYHDLTGDASLANDPISKEIKEILRLMMLLEDPSITVDLRTNNGFCGSRFDIFWNELDGYFNELCDRIITHLNTKYQGPPLPDDIAIPSEEWIRLNFAPSNAYTTKAMQYTGRFNVKYKYEREFNTKYQDYSCFISANDKHKVPIGEDVPVSTGVHNKKTLAPAEGEITVSDHDFTKLSLTPFVTLFINIPCNISESFYDGKVYVCYKDAVFQPSSALRHSTEYFNLINRQYRGQPLPPILSFYTDRGPDHRCTFGSVQITLICLFLAGNFDMLIAVRTAPNHSWCNPAERIISVINYGLQSVAIEREKMPNEFENEFEALKTLEEICEKATENSCLKIELKQCIKKVQELLRERIEHLVWKNEAFETEIPASDSEINEMFENILRINSTLTKNETTKQQLRKHKSLVKFIEIHCQERTYTFQIKKCNQPTCEVCYPVRMPIDIFQNLYFLPDPVPSRDNPDHYKQFANLYGKPTTEQFRPSLINEKSKTEPVPSNILISTKIRDYIRCNSCGKTRCLYSNSQLTEQQKQDLNSVIQAYTYSCGSPIFPDNHSLAQKIFVRIQISCDSPIELLYYSSKKIGNIQVCYWCGIDRDFITPPQSLQEMFKLVYPLCSACYESGKTFYKWLENRVNRKVTKKQKTL